MLEGYPKQVVLRDGIKVILRPMAKDDLDKLREYFKDIAPTDLRYRREDVTDPRVVQHLVDNLDYERITPILAEVDGKIVADASLHRQQGLAQHLGEINRFVGPRYRRKGLGTWLLIDVVSLAMESGLQKVRADFIGELESMAISSAERLGFYRAALIPNYYKDAEGKEYDQIVMMKTIFPDWGEY